jgi:hypothetical protein
MVNRQAKNVVGRCHFREPLLEDDAGYCFLLGSESDTGIVRMSIDVYA